jgi:putative flippase GtrA
MFIVYIIVQIAAYIIDFSIYALLFSLVGWSPISSNVVAKIAAGCFAFFCHRTYTFEANAGENVARQALLYAALLVLNVPVSSALLWIFMAVGAGPIIAKLAADVCGVIINFVLLKSIAFRRTSSGHAA